MFQKIIEKNRNNEFVDVRLRYMVESCESTSLEHRVKNLLEMIFELKELEITEVADYAFERYEENVNYSEEVISSEIPRLTFDSKVSDKKRL